MDNAIKKQEEFMQWLKDHNMYNPYDSASTMQKMREVWEIFDKEKKGKRIDGK